MIAHLLPPARSPEAARRSASRKVAGAIRTRSACMQVAEASIDVIDDVTPMGENNESRLAMQDAKITRIHQQ